jgi:hypothetical protein
MRASAAERRSAVIAVDHPAPSLPPRRRYGRTPTARTPDADAATPQHRHDTLAAG